MKTLIRVLLISLFWGGALPAQALEYSIGLQHAGFLGEKVFFAGLESDDGVLGLDFLVGRSEDSDGQKVDQLSLKFHSNPWTYGFSTDLRWQWLYFGALLTYTDGREFFYYSDGKYPAKNYYPATQRRYGLLTGTRLQHKRLSVYGELVILDKTLESQVASEGTLSWRDSASAALGLRWNF